MGIFGKFFNSLKKTKDLITSKLANLFSHNKSIDEFYEELEEILIMSDVNVKTAMKIVERIRKDAKEQKIKNEDELRDLLRIELTSVLEEIDPVEMEKPAVIMVIGVNGVGKTTSIGKIAYKLATEKNSVTIAAADTFRAAAADQLSVWADRAGVKIIKHKEGADPSSVVFDAIVSAKAKNTDYLIIDTAGRLHVKSNLMEELKKMDRIVSREYPDANFYKLIVLDATTGQNAYAQVNAFNEAIGIDGIILTKLDGTAKGGFVISLCSELEVPVVFVGTGEKIENIEKFDAEEFVSAII